ncbi:MAG TPA: hypothetical protein VFM68_02350 [Candidatus Saccharimonadales bacterium]|nr:hypothetical protein [Candidatus Saccharimonadales bacterium]
MEFEQNQPVTDEERQRAEAKKITLQPIHSDVEPDAPQDAEVAARHVNEPAIANAPIDTDDNANRVQPSQGLLNEKAATPASSSKFVISLGIGVGLSVLGVTVATLL